MQVGDRQIRVEGRLIRIARLAGDGYEFLDDPGATMDGLRRSRTRVDLFTFAQELPDTSPRHRYPMEWDNVAAIAVSSFDQWWTGQVDCKLRNRVRRAEKQGVTIRRVPFDDTLVRGISAIYDETPIRQGRPFWHYGKSLERVREENATFLERSVFLGAFLGPELIGFAKLVIARHQAALMQILAMLRHRDKPAMNAMIAEAVRVCAERGVPYLVYAKFAYGKKAQDSLSDFKRSNGFQRIDVPRYHVPLTRAGALALRLGLHHGVGAYVPETLRERLRRLRSLWWARMLPAAREGA